MALVSAAGCGGGGEPADDATVVLPEPLPADVAPKAQPIAEPGPSTDAGKAKVEGFGTLKGHVILAGDVPEPKMLVAKGDSNVKDAAVCAADGVPAEDLVVDPVTKGVRYAIVYLPRPTAVKPEAESAAKAATPTLDQKGCQFTPHVLAAMKGATVRITSSDPVGHNVNALLTNTKFNTTIGPGAPPLEIPLRAAENRPGMVVCDIHPWMKSWWLVADNPYFAVTDATGAYEIKDVPAGDQKVVVWQEAITAPGFLTPGTGEVVSITPDGETTKDFAIAPDRLRKR
jgi:plastocyanin